MGRYTSRCNLSAARFPLLSDLHGRTVILPQHDMNFQKSAVFAGADQDRDVGVPQVFYAHDVMPTEQGFQAVGYTEVIAAMPGQTEFDQAITLMEGGNKFLFSPGAGNNYVFDAPVLAWASVSPIAALPGNILVTTAFVQGVSYVFYEGVGCFKYNTATKTFDPVVLGGLVAANVKGIVGSNGYLIAFDDDTIYWSSAVNPLDFVPSLVTGANSGTITDLKGIVVCCLATNNGFIVYGTGNAVGGSFTANLRFPFTMKEIPGSGGIRAKEQVSFETNNETHYALTSVGLQELSKTTSKTILFETTDFLTNRVYEDFDPVTKIFTTQYLLNDPYVKLTVVASRYFVISYGPTSTALTFALIYDITQKRWGKVKISHVDCFEYTYPNLYGVITYAMLLALGDTYADLINTPYSGLNSAVATAEKPRRTIAFLQSDGTVKLLTFDLGQTACNAVFLLGKFQFLRGHYIQLLGFDVENAIAGGNYEAFVLPSLDGKNFAPFVIPYLQVNAGLLRSYRCRNTAVNETLLFQGSFNLTSAQIVYAQGGQIR